jgi:glyoxylase-like metal-dependent hydrolase (beta-lactamase superfamily II)
MRQLYPINAGNFKCDGGALFSVVPKSLWGKKYPSDENNLCTTIMRCLLVVDGDRKVLIDAGAGDKYDEKYARNSGLHGEATLLGSLAEVGIKPEDITDMFFTHLHWDHCGGAIVKSADGNSCELLFPKAVHWVAKSQWEQAWNPNVRDGNAFFEADLVALRDSGKLKFIEDEGELFSGFEIRIFNGHTPGQMLPVIGFKGRKVIFTGDLIPVAANIPVPWIASYDLFPVTVMEEKATLLNEIAENGMVLFFEHDYYAECAELKPDERWPVLKRTFVLAEL